jgi:phage tail-like protein
MSLVTQDALTGDPMVGFNFMVLVDGKLTGYFTEISGVGSETEVTEHKIVGNGDREAVRKVPGRHKWGDITLKRGVTANMDMWTWRQMIIDGKVNTARSNGSIYMCDQSGIAIAQWDFEKAWPSKISGPQFQADSSAVGIEELTLVHEGLTRIK